MHDIINTRDIIREGKMIPAINSATSFKKIYKPNDNPFSKSQMNVINNIEKKIANKAEEKDFLIEPCGKKGVELHRIYGVVEHNYPYSYLNCTFDKKVYCGFYDEFTPFNPENIDLIEENHINAQACLNIAKNILIAILASAALIGGALAVRNKINTTKAQTEFIQKTDTLKNSMIKNIK